jgi:tRNA (cytidine/uridine-2'-O-)-methyltransferase
MVHIVLHQPEIPQNTGNIARTCAVLGARLHLIEPLGFNITEKSVKRAGLDYWHLLKLEIHPSWQDFKTKQTISDQTWEERAYCLTTKGKYRYDAPRFPKDSYLIFGKETQGLPLEILQWAGDRAIRIPMKPEVRSLNLSNAVAICAYEVFRQWDFPDFTTQGLLAQA